MRIFIVLAALLSLAIPSAAFAQLSKDEAIRQLQGAAAPSPVPEARAVPEDPAPVYQAPAAPIAAPPAPKAGRKVIVDFSTADTNGCPLEFGEDEVNRPVAHRCTDGTYLGFRRQLNQDGTVTAKLRRTYDVGLTQLVTRTVAPAPVAASVAPPAPPPMRYVDNSSVSARPGASCQDVPHDVNYRLVQPTAGGGTEYCSRGANPTLGQTVLGLGLVAAAVALDGRCGYYDRCGYGGYYDRPYVPHGPYIRGGSRGGLPRR